jgi:hypothetical protein
MLAEDDGTFESQPDQIFLVNRCPGFQNRLTWKTCRRQDFPESSHG